MQPTPVRRAISRIGTLPTNFNRRTSRTWRMIVLSAGIRSLLWEQPKERDLSRAAEAPATPGEIIPEWWATSFRNHGRLAPESALAFQQACKIRGELLMRGISCDRANPAPHHAGSKSDN